MEGKHIAATAVGAVIKVVVIAVVIMYVYRFSMTAYDYGFRIFGETPVSEAPGETVTVAILEGSSTKGVGKILEEKGLIRDADLFYWQEKVSSYAGEIKPGVYELSTSMTVEEMMEIIAAEDETEEAAGENSDTQENAGTAADETEPAEPEGSRP